MPLDVRRLRKWFAFGAIAVVIMVAALYVYGRIRLLRSVGEIPGKLGVEVQQSTEGFTLSKSEGGRTLFTVKASKAVQFKQGGRAQLHEVSIEVFGREGNRYDRIYGSDFSYEPQTGDIAAQGEVHIDIGSAQNGGQQDAVKDSIHFQTSGVVFNQKTGFAATKQRIEFRIPQASGWAMGATYDSRKALLTLESSVHVRLAQGADIVAQHGTITRDPRQAVLSVVRVEQPSGTADADKLTIALSENNTVERILAGGSFRAQSRSSAAAAVRSSQAEFFLAKNDALRSAVLTGDVSFEQGGQSPVRGSASRAVLDFGPRNSIGKIRATGGVKLAQAGEQQAELSAESLDVLFRNGRPQRAQTGGAGAAQIALREKGAQGETVATAAQFDIQFANGRLASLHGAPDARIVSRAPGQPERTSSSRQLDATFNSGAKLAAIVQQGEVSYQDGQMTATAEKAAYNPQNETLALTGSPRMAQSGMLLTAETMRFNRRTGEATAEGDVKTTYNEVRQQPSGAMLATADPIHVTAARMTAGRNAAIARYSGGARLWQGANIVEAAAIEFDRDRRSILASSSATRRVSTVFVEGGRTGRVTPVNVTAARLSYEDSERRARFEGGVVLKGADLSVTADRAEVRLQPQGQKTGAAAASQVEEITAVGHVAIEQPSRKATGELLVYTAYEGKFVLTGGPPSIFDAEHGRISGDSLTFYSRDGRVLVGSRDSSRTVTHTRVNR